MKKTLLAVLCVLSAISFAFVGCQQDSYDVTGTITDSSLPGPANFKADPDANLQGAIRLTWDPVIDAKGYEIWRKTGSEAYAKLSNAQASQGEYFDYISTDNLLQNSTTYSYLIVALSDKSSAGNGRAVADIVQNGKSETSFKTRADQFPAIGTKIAADITAVTLETKGDFIYASWAADPNKAVRYYVTSTNGSRTVKNPSYVLGVWEETLQVQAVFGGSGNYYLKGAMKYENLPTIWNSDSTGNFSASRDNRQRVELTFTNIGTDVTYTVYKAKNESGIAFVWSEVSTAGKVLNQNNAWEVIDTDAVPTDESWVYRIVARNGAGNIIWTTAAQPVIGKDNIQQVKALNLSVNAIGTPVTTNPSANYDDRTWKIYITYETEDGATYTLYRQKYGKADGTFDYNDPNRLGDWEVFTPAIPVEANNSATIAFTPSALRQQYNYKVIGTKDGYRAREEHYDQFAPLTDRLQFKNGSTTIDASNYYLGNYYNDYTYKVPAGGAATDQATVLDGLVVDFGFLYGSNPVQDEKIILYGKAVNGNWEKVKEWTTTEAITYRPNYSIANSDYNGGQRGYYYKFTFGNNVSSISDMYTQFKVELNPAK